MGETLAESHIQGIVVGVVVVPASVVTVEGRVRPDRWTSTGCTSVVGVAVQNTDQLATERAHVVGFESQVFCQLVLNTKAVLLVVRSNQVLVDVTRDRLRQAVRKQGWIYELCVAGEWDSQ